MFLTTEDTESTEKAVGNVSLTLCSALRLCGSALKSGNAQATFQLTRGRGGAEINAKAPRAQRTEFVLTTDGADETEVLTTEAAEGH